MEMKERAQKYFLLADQYLETSKLILNSLVENENSNFGLGTTWEECEKNCLENSLKSDFTLFIPTIFASLQSIELFVKGLLLLNGLEIQNDHETSNMICEIKKIYGENSEIYKSINSFYNEQVIIIKEFKKVNTISTTKELYEALRYPEDNNKDINNKKYYVYYNLHGNGEYGKKYFKTLIKKIDRVKSAILEEYKNKN